MASRNRTLDGLRGCLAALVLIDHACTSLGNAVLMAPAAIAVWVFFAISGYVLTGAWDGRYGAFLLRRAIRLWPVYALCLAAGAVLSGSPPPVMQYAWLPLENALSGPIADTPAWSLTIEAWAMLLMPAYVWVSRRSFPWLVAALVLVPAAAAALANVLPVPLMIGFFFVGAWLTRFKLRWAVLESPIPQWLGRISYPLYLCHWPIIVDLNLPVWASVPLAFAVADVLSRTVEAWSIRASRRVGRLTLKGEGSKNGALQTG